MLALEGGSGHSRPSLSLTNPMKTSLLAFITALTIAAFLGSCAKKEEELLQPRPRLRPTARRARRRPKRARPQRSRPRRRLLRKLRRHRPRRPRRRRQRLQNQLLLRLRLLRLRKRTGNLKRRTRSHTAKLSPHEQCATAFGLVTLNPPFCRSSL